MLPTALLLASALATGVSAPDQADLEARVDALMADYSGDVPGASVLVVHDGSVVLRKAYGLADVENGIAATTATNYRLASVTKQFTAASILLLAQDGKLALDDPARAWLPALPSATRDITLRHLRVGQASADIRFHRTGDGKSRYEVLETRGKLRILAEASPWALNAKLGELQW